MGFRGPERLTRGASKVLKFIEKLVPTRGIEPRTY